MLNGNQKVDAIAWEAKKQGVSYGMFSAMLKEDRKQQIYKAYDSRNTMLPISNSTTITALWRAATASLHLSLSRKAPG